MTLRLADGMESIPAHEWDGLEATRRLPGRPYNPFISRNFLLALEKSGSATARTGWSPCHLLLETGAGELAGAAPCYLKSHSQGEYVFDHGWANAFERAGGQYYPKLQIAVPFTPATGPRLLVSRSGEPAAVRAALADGLRQITDRLGVSSAHVTFLPGDEAELLRQRGFLLRTDQQFHFTNRGFSDYREFLATLSSRKRKALRKEREMALSAGISVEWRTGADLTEEVWDIFFDFYQDTGARKWGRPYLTRRFFSLVGESMAEDIVLILARRDGRYIAGALNFLGSDTIYGRYWGCTEDHPYLHFELCYHQAIDYAIAHRLATVEAGAQGEHKLARGYLPVTTLSAHYIVHPGLRRAVADYLAEERRDVRRVGEILTAHGPYRKEPGPLQQKEEEGR